MSWNSWCVSTIFDVIIVYNSFTKTLRQFKNCFPDSSFKIQMSSDYVQQLTNMFWQFHLSSYILTYSQMHWFYTMRDSLNIMACEHNKVKKWFRTRGSPQLSNPYSALMPKSFQVLSNINSCTKTTYLYVNETEFQKIIHVQNLSEIFFDCT